MDLLFLNVDLIHDFFNRQPSARMERLGYFSPTFKRRRDFPWPLDAQSIRIPDPAAVVGSIIVCSFN